MGEDDADLRRTLLHVNRKASSPIYSYTLEKAGETRFLQDAN